jgi:hypothetical protein
MNGFGGWDAERAQHLVSASRRRQLLPLLTWVAALGAAIGFLLLMGRGELSTPSILEPSAWPAWAAGRDPLEVAFAILRLVGLAAAWYLLGATTIGAVARLLRWGRLIEAADILTVPSVRRLLQAALGLGLATAAVTGTTMGHGVVPRTPGTVVAAHEPAGSGEIVPIAAGPGTTDMLPVSPATSTQVPPGVSAQALSPLAPPASPSVSGQVASVVPTPSPVPLSSAPMTATEVQAAAAEEQGTYVVQHGDHLWGIAEAMLAKAWGHQPTDAQIIPYWRHLIETNRAVLVDPGNPDLILPGQTFTVPPPPAEH